MRSEHTVPPTFETEKCFFRSLYSFNGGTEKFDAFPQNLVCLIGELISSQETGIMNIFVSEKDKDANVTTPSEAPKKKAAANSYSWISSS